MLSRAWTDSEQPAVSDLMAIIAVSDDSWAHAAIMVLLPMNAFASPALAAQRHFRG